MRMIVIMAHLIYWYLRSFKYSQAIIYWLYVLWNTPVLSSLLL